MDLADLSTGTVGKPMTGLEIRLVDWEEGNYRVTDRPNPRGEIVIAGDPVAKGYLNPDMSNVETFFEEGGRRWFRTGDIGEFDDHGKSFNSFGLLWKSPLKYSEYICDYRRCGPIDDHHFFTYANYSADLNTGLVWYPNGPFRHRRSI
jgi:acyl-CoA synthetase (AMP-forming)/AMP-acid ligase II